MQVNFYSAFIDESYRRASAAQAKDQDAAVQEFLTKSKAEGKSVSYLQVDHIEREWNSRIQRPPLKSLIDHIDHIAQVAGVEITLAWYLTLMALAVPCPKEWIQPLTCRRLPRPCSTGAISRTM